MATFVLIKLRGWYVRVKDCRNGRLERNCLDTPARRRGTQGYDPDERERKKGLPVGIFPIKANRREVVCLCPNRKLQDGRHTKPKRSWCSPRTEGGQDLDMESFLVHPRMRHPMRKLSF